jgi:dethiobiotin synthetase
MQIACIIGTDTEIGKTYSCCKIMEYLAHKNHPIATLKPIASGGSMTEYGFVNEDVYSLFKANSHSLALHEINQFSFSEPIAPHIAAKLDGQELNSELIISQTSQIINQTLASSHILIEGVGGLMVPLNERQTYLDLLIKWNHPIILVVGMKLGCLNHALLTIMVLRQYKLPVVGFIANQIAPNMLYYTENLDYLVNKLDVPLFATIDYQGQLQPTKSFKEFFKCQ